RVLYGRRPGDRAGHARRDPLELRAVREPVRERQARGPGALPLPGAGLRRRSRAGGKLIKPRDKIVEDLRVRLERLGSNVTSIVWRLGFASRFLFYMVMHSGTAFRRFRLTVAEVYFAGVLSLIII